MNLLEIVPHKINTFADEVKALFEQYPQIDGINIPDVLSLKYRSHEGAEKLLKAGIRAIPHFRSIDRPLEDLCDLVKSLIDIGLKDLLIVKGDNPQQINTKTYSVTTIMAVKKIKDLWPNLKVYCALDPYRDSFKKELEFCNIKKMAGIDGFFTQPFFDPELARIYIEQIANTEIFIGHCPVLNEASLNYWETKNNAIFPKSFKMDLEHNCSIAKELLQLAKKFNQHTYLMPILTPLDPYLRGIF